RWAMELTRGLRYRFTLVGDDPAVVDATTGRAWILHAKTDDESSTEDYMIVTRLMKSRTGRFLVAGAGLTQFGTEETGRILTAPEVLEPILAKLPAGWRDKNLQLVLHSEILANSPAPPGVLASWV